MFYRADLHALGMTAYDLSERVYGIARVRCRNRAGRFDTPSTHVRHTLATGN